MNISNEMELMKLTIRDSFISFIRNIKKNITVGKQTDDKKCVYGILITIRNRIKHAKACQRTSLVFISLLKSAIIIPENV